MISNKGLIIPVEVTGRKANFKEQQVQVTSFLDISSRLETENKIKLLNTAVEQSTHSIIITDKLGNIEYVNPSFTKITKYNPDDVFGKNISIIGSGQHSKEYFENIWNTINNGQPWKGQFHNKNKLGEYYWADSTITPIKDQNGETSHFLSIMEDISIKKKQQEEYDKITTRLKLTIQAANFGFWEYNFNTKETYWDDNMYDFFALDKSTNPDLYEYFSSHFDFENFQKIRSDILFGLQQKNVIDLETKVNVKGEERIFNSYILANPAAENDSKSILGITYDITEQKQFEKELIDKRKKAEESDQLKSAFLANMSHEIRTPLNGIIGFTSLLEEDYSDFSNEEIIRYLKIISTNGKHLLSLVNDIIDISKIESDQLVIAKQKFKLGDIISKLEETFKEISNPEVQLIFEDQFSDLELKTDSTRLTQILNNLISNAIKFTTKGHIKIGHTIKDKYLYMWVEDTGKGIPNEAKPRIFQRFAQGQPIKDQLLGGTGLGLSITKGLVNLLGGTIWFESEINNGSTFHFKILINNNSD